MLEAERRTVAALVAEQQETQGQQRRGLDRIEVDAASGRAVGVTASKPTPSPHTKEATNTGHEQESVYASTLDRHCNRLREENLMLRAQLLKYQGQ
mmetsp:Transcript_37738/g.88210  ORF Transcript_37738/g.88210 Transcript_37738/m.88210 type:complete len:96 (-) Transcript_37738:2281-2568(-)